MAVIQRYPCPHELDPRYILQNCLRKVPPVTARTWDKLQTELNELTEFYTSQETPNYKAANSTQLAAGVACEMSQQKIPEADVMRWITLGILGRKRHTIYLSSIYVSGYLTKRRRNIICEAKAPRHLLPVILQRTFVTLLKDDLVEGRVLVNFLSPRVSTPPHCSCGACTEACYLHSGSRRKMRLISRTCALFTPTISKNR
eukprot:GHVT01068362.1.p1 GENE.GHVT01068362.1~~GHVT01068362.1.p1  ORF type:complete len:201 (-),score=2.29 GHVT01068362.1:2078-2680(-)